MTFAFVAYGDFRKRAAMGSEAFKQETAMLARDIGVREVDTATSDESAQIAAERMHARNVGTLVVVNDRDEPIGMLTDRDLALRVVGVGKDPFRTTVGQAMTQHPMTLSGEATLESAIAAMCAEPCRRLPLVDPMGKLVGLVSLDDVLRLLVSDFTQIGNLLWRESPANLAHG
jgi:CBS domain-containing protein